MSTDKLITVEELARQIKMAAEGIKKKPGLIQSTLAATDCAWAIVNRDRKEVSNCGKRS